MCANPLVVQAIYSFKGTNNDELCFKKGDKITITQKDDEGWWEGTLGDKTGWFPSNYVKECKDTVIQPLSPVAQQRQYRAVVLKDIIDSEKAHVSELHTLVKNFLKPLEKSTILTTDEYRQLTGNINEVVDTHQQLLNLIEECETKASDDQRVGKLFLTWAPRIKAVHQAYCSMHPKAVCILDLHKDELATYMESCGAATPGLLVLTTGLSKPFRRLDKYSGMLQELERHVEINHVDRGDIQRSVAVYKDIASTCAATRRQKELELQVLTGPVRGWEGQSLAQLGDIIHMGLVSVGPQHLDRYLVLFPNTLLVLSVSHRMSAFIYEGKLPLTNINVLKLEDSELYKNVFEISGPLIEKIIAVCQTKDEAIHWVELLRQHTNKGHIRSPPPPSIDGLRPNLHLDQRGYSTLSSILNYFYSPVLPYIPILPPPNYAPASPYCTLTKSFYRLVKEKIITHRLLKTLLYSEHVKFIDTSKVLRRHHKTEIVINTDTDYDRCGSSSSEDSTDSKNCLTRQNAIYDTDSDSDKSDTSSFGFVRYFNTESSEHTEGSLIDQGENKSKTENSKLTLAVVNQISAESGSSFEITTKPYMACEDLVNIDESIEIDLLNTTKKYVRKERHSLPSKFVGNKFNKSSMTLVYIPHWSNSESNIAKSISKASNSSSSGSETTTHSSSIDLPINPIPIPDAMIAEILYNFDQDQNSEEISLEKKVLTPPTMFQNDFSSSTTSLDKIQNKKSITDSLSSLSLQYANVNFRKHSINSDKPKRMSSTRDTSEECENLEHTTEKELKSIDDFVHDATKHSLSLKRLDKATNTVLDVDKSTKPAVLPKPSNIDKFEPLRRSKSHSIERTLEKDNPDFKPRIIYCHVKPKIKIPYDETINVVKLEDVPVSPDGLMTPKDELELFEKVTSQHNNITLQDRPGSSKEHDLPLSVEVNQDASNIEDNPTTSFEEHSGRNLQHLRRRSSHEEVPNVPQIKPKKANSLRKCVSYHYLQIGKRTSCMYSPFCRCCTEPCFSRRSSDSGMAGSCTLNSPDILANNDNERFLERDHYSLVNIPNYENIVEARNVVSYSEMEAKDFEAQCRCTSPFGSTPRTSCQASTSDNVMVETHDLSSTSVTSSCSDMSPFPIPQPWEAENQIHDKIMSVKKQQLQKNPSTSKWKSCDNFVLEENRDQAIFRSGLYAHWWMKAKLPVSVIKGLVEEKNSSTADVSDRSDSEQRSPKLSPKPS